MSDQDQGPLALPGEVWRTPSGQSIVCLDGSTVRVWAQPGERRWELFGEPRARVIEAWAMAERARAEKAEKIAAALGVEVHGA